MDMRRYARSTRYILKLLSHLLSKTDLVLCNSDAGRIVHARLGCRPPRWRVVPNGVDVDRFRPRPGERAAFRTLYSESLLSGGSREDEFGSPPEPPDDTARAGN